MKVAIQQPHYFPWIGYFDKMAKVDLFVLLDEVQLEKRSPMTRNRVLGPGGSVEYISVAANQRGHRGKRYNEILISDDSSWKKKNLSQLQEYYRKAPFYEEILPILQQFYCADWGTLCEWSVSSIQMLKELLEIPTQLVYQKDVSYDRSNKKSDLILDLCIHVNADLYVAGRGASVQYLDREAFEKNRIKIVFQDFQHPVYPQANAPEFVSGISALDMLFNCGIKKTRDLFWENVRNSREFENIEG